MIRERRQLSDGLLVGVEGEIDYANSPSLRVELLATLQKKPRRLVIDLTAVRYMDSSGVATLVEALQAIRAYQGRLILCGLQPKVRGMIEIARLDTVFLIAPDSKQAAAL
jgi:anti-sigma B factor antagonist